METEPLVTGMVGISRSEQGTDAACYHITVHLAVVDARYRVKNLRNAKPALRPLEVEDGVAVLIIFQVCIFQRRRKVIRRLP